MWITSTLNGNNQVWYSEEEYEILKQENQEANEIITELEYKNKQYKKELEILRNIKERKKQ